MTLRKMFNKTSIVLGAMTLLATTITAVSALSMITSCDKPGYVAITYDDGPYNYTSDLVKLLDSKNITATFFVNGDNFLKLNESLVAQDALRDAYSSGHQIASHTWSHKNLVEIVDDEETFNQEIVLLEQALQDLIGVKPAFIRPPYGAVNDRVLEKLTERNYQVVTWNIDTKDYETHNLELEMKNINSSFSAADRDTNGYIILSHDVYEQTADELTHAMIEYIEQEGFNTCTVAECVGESAYK